MPPDQICSSLVAWVEMGFDLQRVHLPLSVLVPGIKNLHCPLVPDGFPRRHQRETKSQLMEIGGFREKSKASELSPFFPYISLSLLLPSPSPNLLSLTALATQRPASGGCLST